MRPKPANNRESAQNSMGSGPKTAPSLAPSEIVLKALRDSPFLWRTIDGIAAETKLDRDIVRAELQCLGDQVIRSGIPDRKGRSLFALRDRYKKKSRTVNRILTAFSDVVR